MEELKPELIKILFFISRHCLTQRSDTATEKTRTTQADGFGQKIAELYILPQGFGQKIAELLPQN